MTEKRNRRELLGLGPRGASPAARGFSVADFYARRQASGQAGAPLPRFELRPGLAGNGETSAIGTPELAPELERTLGPTAAQPIAGVVRILTGYCLAHQGSACTACSTHCPEAGAIVTAGALPRVDPERCTGCGICIQVCPAPVNAFAIVPTPHAAGTETPDA